MKNVVSHRRNLCVFSTFIILLSLVFIHVRSSFGAVRAPHIFGNDMVLQRDVTTPVWGWANPGEKIEVDIGDLHHETVADSTGKWRVELASQPAGGPFEMTIRATNTIKFTNVYYGEVWICSGQSNMSFALKRSKNGKTDAKTATYPQLRFLTVPTHSAEEPQNDFSAKWMCCTPQTAPEVSAIAFYFGQYLHEKLQVPIGIIISAWSGSTGEAWTERNELAKFPELSPLVEQTRLDKAPPSQKAGCLFNGMIAPICPYAVKGVVWYQGESNTNRAWQYRTLFPILIADWREKWGRGDLPFLFVQLPNYMETRDVPSSSAWAELREAQHKTLAVRNVSEVVTIDVGEAKELHPKDKQTVALRLANVALAKYYGKDTPSSGPEFKSMKISGNKAILYFTHVYDGLLQSENSHCDGSILKGFAIAGADRKFHWAEATIVGVNQVIVSAPNVPQPVAVRYAWADNPICNLVNSAGLPASPFRTDDWAGVTVDAQ